MHVWNWGSTALAVNLADDVKIFTNGVNGVEVSGGGQISIVSAADITVIAPTANSNGTNGLFGWIASGSGDINIDQLANSTITVVGDEGTGIYAFTLGTGSIVLTSAGNVSTAGYRGYGINAWNIGSDSQNATVFLSSTGTVLTNGVESAGLYSLNYGLGNALAIADGQIITLQAESDGVLADIDTGDSAGNAVVVLSDTAIVHTMGGNSRGAWALNWGLGDATVTSSGTVTTDGEDSHGIQAEIRTSGQVVPSSANTVAYLEQNGTVLTNGIAAMGVYSLNAGHGNAIATTDGQVTTLQASSSGVVAEISSGDGPGTAQVLLSDTAIIRTLGDGARGGWALNQGLGDATIVSSAAVTTNGVGSHGLQAEIRDGKQLVPSTADAVVQVEGNATIAISGVASHGLFADNQGFGAATVTMASGSSVITSGDLANGADARSLGTASFVQATGAPVTVSGAQAFGVNVVGATLASANINSTVTASGAFGVGASSHATTGISTMWIAANSTVTGGWQADVASLGGTTIRPSAGVLMGSDSASELINFGVIGAGSDRAIADIGHYTAASGNLTVGNGGLITGFVELADGGINSFKNASLFDVRHFADTNGDGVRDIKRVSISDFGAATSSFNNLSGATVRLAPVLGEAAVDAADYYIPTTGIDSRPLEASYYALGRAGIVQGQFTNLGAFNNAGVLDLRGSATGNTLVMTANAAAGGAAGNGSLSPMAASFGSILC